MTGHGAEARERWVARASELLHTLFATFPGLPHTRLAQSKIHHNKVSPELSKSLTYISLSIILATFSRLPHMRRVQSKIKHNTVSPNRHYVWSLIFQT